MGRNVSQIFISGSVLFRDVEAPTALSSPIKIPVGGGFFSSSSSVKVLDGGGSYSSILAGFASGG